MVERHHSVPILGQAVTDRAAYMEQWITAQRHVRRVARCRAVGQRAPKKNLGEETPGQRDGPHSARIAIARPVGQAGHYADVRPRDEEIPPFAAPERKPRKHELAVEPDRAALDAANTVRKAAEPNLESIGVQKLARPRRRHERIRRHPSLGGQQPIAATASAVPLKNTRPYNLRPHREVGFKSGLTPINTDHQHGGLQDGWAYLGSI